VSNPSPRVRRAFRLWQVFVVVSLLLSVAAILVLRVQVIRERFSRWLPVYVKEPGHEHTGHFYVYHRRWGWRNVPGWKAKTRGLPLTINSRGLRDREHPVAKPKGTGRVLVLGDSFAWGYGVADQDLFTEVLERDFVDNPPQGPWEVINTGVSGWGTDQQYLYLMDEGFDYEPDVVVLAFYLLNDPKEVKLSDTYGLSKPVFLDLDLTLGNVPVPLPSAPKTGLESEADRLALVVRLMEEIEKECRSRKCRLVVMKFGTFADPTFEGLLEIDKKFRERLSGLEERIEFLDLDQAFVDREIQTKYLVAGNEDNHWNDFGHRKVAEILSEFLRRRGLLGRVPVGAVGQESHGPQEG